jgi:penicillin-binding protein 2
MDRDQERIDSFSRRAFVVGALQGCALAVLGFRLSWLQIVEGEKYKTLAENNRISIKIIPPSRGQIVDRFGVPLATNIQNFQLLVNPEEIENLDKAIADIRKLISVDDASIRKAKRQAKRNASFVPVEIRDKLNWEEVSIIELNLPKLPGVFIQAGELRNYPYKEATAHIIGYVGRVSEKEIKADPSPLLSMPGFQIGKSSIERYYEDKLRGQAGKAEVEVNVHGRTVRQLKTMPSQQGGRLILSLDAEYQRFVQQRLATERSAAAIVMDAKTGAVYALANHPSFDPNIFTGGIPTMDWEQLRDDPAHPLNNKVAAGLYPPGSTFKMVTALAGLEAGVIDQNTSVFCPGHYDFGGNRFHCWKPGGHGTVNLNKAIAQSCDVYFYKMSTQVGVDKIAAMARRLGLGSELDFDLPETKTAPVPDTAWKRKQKDKVWHPGETINISIGQGYMLASPLQLAVMTARMVNGGKAVKPWLAGYIDDKKIYEVNQEDLGLNPAHLEMMKDGMAAVMKVGGTAVAQQIKEAGFEMGGKTGTSQVKRITKAERAAGIRRQEDLPWHLRHHALFVGYAPVDNPQYVCSVIVEHGGSGSGAAAPIARDLLHEVQKRNPANKAMEKQ